MAQIVTITNPLTGQPAQVDQLDHTAQQIDDAIARALPGGAIDITLQNKMGGIESTDYPGCYYRTVDGVVEWFNPPMYTGKEYRTTERYIGKPVYVKAIDFGAAPNSTLKAVSIGTANIEKIVDFKWMYSDGNDIGMLITNPNFTLVAANTGNVVIETNADVSSFMIKAVVKYIKTTD